jgi:hypothetical protein
MALLTEAQRNDKEAWLRVLNEILSAGLYDINQDGYLISNIDGTEVRCFNVMFWTGDDEWQEEEFAHTMIDDDSESYLDRVAALAVGYDAGTKVQVYEVRKGSIMVNLEEMFVTTYENLDYCGSEDFIWNGDKLVEDE